MRNDKDSPNLAFAPPIAFALAAAAGLALNWYYPLAFLPPAFPGVWVGGALVLAGLAVIRWSALSFRAAKTNVHPSQATTAIVENGPYGFSRNPIYAAGMLAMIGLAIAFDSIWLLGTLVIVFVIIRQAVVLREEAYLEKKFGAPYLAYKSSVRRWL